MNQTLKEAAVKRYHYTSHDQLREHFKTFVDTYNFAKSLKTLRALTPFEFVNKYCKDKPEQFYENPENNFPGPNSQHQSTICNFVSVS